MNVMTLKHEVAKAVLLKMKVSNIAALKMAGRAATLRNLDERRHAGSIGGQSVGRGTEDILASQAHRIYLECKLVLDWRTTHHDIRVPGFCGNISSH